MGSEFPRGVLERNTYSHGLPWSRCRVLIRQANSQMRASFLEEGYTAHFLPLKKSEYEHIPLPPLVTTGISSHPFRLTVPADQARDTQLSGSINGLRFLFLLPAFPLSSLQLCSAGEMDAQEGNI